MSWRKEQYEESYNRADNRTEECEEYQDYVEETYIRSWWDCDDWYSIFDHDDQRPSMRDLMIGRLLTVLSKLKIRGSKALLDEWYW